ncbi:MAG TPA: iron-sulfur cluster assembly scaffold protein [Thermoanaerobaculia bacterium]|jgi:hypothetical protein
MDASPASDPIGCGRPCCGSKRRRSIGDYFDDGRCRSRRPPLPIEGATQQADDGVWTSFSLDLDGDRIAAVSFRSSTCITLVASCECLVEIVEGLSLREAAVASSQLVDRLPGVPEMKRHRAALARSAFLAALQKALNTSARTSWPRGEEAE